MSEALSLTLGVPLFFPQTKKLKDLCLGHVAQTQAGRSWKAMNHAMVRAESEAAQDALVSPRKATLLTKTNAAGPQAWAVPTSTKPVATQ